MSLNNLIQWNQGNILEKHFWRDRVRCASGRDSTVFAILQYCMGNLFYYPLEKNIFVTNKSNANYYWFCSIISYRSSFWESQCFKTSWHKQTANCQCNVLLSASITNTFKGPDPFFKRLWLFRMLSYPHFFFIFG